jgi:hypothetical protein
MARNSIWACWPVCLILVSGVAYAEDPFIAGETPDVRPAQAPVLTTHIKGEDWYCRALVGIARPYPASLRFLEDQGAWYSPFIVAGMTSPYDIRNRHGADICRRR